MGGIVSEKILRAQFVADGAKCLIELLDRRSIIIFSAGIFRELNQRMFAAGVAAGTGFNRHIDNAVDDDFGLAQRIIAEQ